MKLSILIPTLPSRAEQLKKVLNSLGFTHNGLLNEILEPAFNEGVAYFTMADDPYEVITFTDNKELTTGAKRNRLLQEASGDYLTFVDDDDTLSGSYLKYILKAIEKQPDLIVYNVEMFQNGKYKYLVKYGREYENNQSDKNKFATRVPNHLMVWKSEIAKQVKFPDLVCGEDSAWADAMRKTGLIRKQHRINKTLYYYMFDQEKTEAQ